MSPSSEPSTGSMSSFGSCTLIQIAVVWRTALALLSRVSVAPLAKLMPCRGVCCLILRCSFLEGILSEFWGSQTQSCEFGGRGQFFTTCCTPGQWPRHQPPATEQLPQAPTFQNNGTHPLSLIGELLAPHSQLLMALPCQSCSLQCGQ